MRGVGFNPVWRYLPGYWGHININILFAGDPHGDFRQIVCAVEDRQPEAVVILGDMDLKLPLEQALCNVSTATQVWWIPGNHDADRVEWYDNLFGSALADRNLHGRVVEVAGVRIAGLGGIFREEVWHPDTGIEYPTRQNFMKAKRADGKWRDGVARKHRVSIWWEDYEKLFDQRADVLVTHEAPSCHKHGFRELDELAQAMRVHTVVHGHHHVRYSSTIANGDIRVHGVGRAGVSDLHGQVVVPGPDDYRQKAWQRQA